MKFHNQRNFMGHTISNVTNKPLLHKKGKQWIVVAISALILAGFGGMVSTTTHADTVKAQPTTTKVANNPAKASTPAPTTNNNTKPSSVKPVAPKATQPNTKSIGQQASNLHKNLVNNSINNSNNNPKPKITTLGLSTPRNITNNQDQNVVAHGYWKFPSDTSTTNKPEWNLTKDGTLTIFSPNNTQVQLENRDYIKPNGYPSWTSYMNNLPYMLGITSSDASKVKTLNFGTSGVKAPADSLRLLDDESGIKFNNLTTLDLTNLHLSDVKNGTAMFGGLSNLTNVIGLKTPTNFNASLLFVNDPKLKSIDLTNMSPISSSTGGMFAYDNNLTTITLGPNNSLTGSELFNGDGVAMPSNQATWTPLSGHNVTVGYGSNNTLSKNNTWNVGNTPLQATDTIKYINSENGEPISCDNIHYSGSDAQLKGTYGSKVSDSMWTSSHWYDANMPAYCNATPFDEINTKYSDSRRNQDGTKNQLLYNGGTYTIQITPNKAYVNVNYVDQDGNNEGQHQFNGDYYQASGAIKQTFGYTPKGLSGYYVINPNTQIQFNNGNQQVEVAKNINQTINYQWNDRSVGSYTVSGYPGQSYTVTGQGLQPGWTLNNGAYNGIDRDGHFQIQSKGTTLNDGVKPNQVTDPIAYQYNGKTINTSNHYQGNDYRTEGSHISNTTFTLGNNPVGMPQGFHLVNSSDASKSRNFDGTTQNIAIEPNIDHDYLIYELNTNHHQIGTSTSKDKSNGYISGPDYNASQLANNKGANIQDTFTVSDNTNDPNLPEGYHVVSGDGSGNKGLTFNYQTTPTTAHVVYVAPNTVTVHYNNGNQNISSSTASYVSGSSTYDNFAIPANYSLASNQSNNSLSFNKNSYSVNVRVTPSQETDTIDYIANYTNGSTLVSSASSTGNDYQAQNATNTQFTVTSAPANYQLVPNKDNTFNYDGHSHDVAVELIQNDQKTYTNIIDYVNNSIKIASDEYTGNAGTKSPFYSYAPSGYHTTAKTSITFNEPTKGSNNVTIYPTHNVTVYPNSITLKFNNGQVGSKKIDNLKGTTYQIKSSDLPANYQLTNADDANVDLSKFGDSTDYNVDVTPIQQHVTPSTPSVPSDNIQPAPYIPSMPTSVVSSASSVESTPASVASTISKPSSESKPTHYSHYRYAKVITPLQLHTSKHFTRKNGVLTIKHPTEFKIMKIVHDHKYARYEVRYQGHNYFITANDHFTINNYVQKHDFKSHKHMMIRVITPLIEYKHARFNRKYAIKVFKKGAVLPVKKVFTIGKGEMTRFQLTNNRFITSNKLFVKVIK